MHLPSLKVGEGSFRSGEKGESTRGFVDLAFKIEHLLFIFNSGQVKKARERPRPSHYDVAHAHLSGRLAEETAPRGRPPDDGLVLPPVRGGFRVLRGWSVDSEADSCG